MERKQEEKENQNTVDKLIEELETELNERASQNVEEVNRREETKQQDDKEIISILDQYARYLKEVVGWERAQWLKRKEFLISPTTTLSDPNHDPSKEENEVILQCCYFSENYFEDMSKRGRPPKVTTSTREETPPHLPPFPKNFLIRGLFTLDGEVVIRGYDKFFQVEKTELSQWKNLKDKTEGPYEVTLKEDGCILFVSWHSVTGLLVTSKHNLRHQNQLEAPGDGPYHHEVGERWLKQHLEKSHISQSTLIQFLAHFKVTLVFELCDDSFEEHILSYQTSPGLYLHGINHNKLQLQTWSSSLIRRVADYFGFRTTEYFLKDNLTEVRQLSELTNGYLHNQPIEGFVVRCKRTTTGETYFFKIKFDFPYNLFREWREVTNRLLLAHTKREPLPVIRKFHYTLTSKYIPWVTKKFQTEPELFQGYVKNQGVIRVRELFLTETGHSPSDQHWETEPAVVDTTNPKFLIIPVATPGTGKTTMLTVLTQLFQCAHVQKDNFDIKPEFYQEIVNQFKKVDLVLVDRNNHIHQLREELTSFVIERYPNVIIIGIQWGFQDPTELSPSKLFEVTYRNILKRGGHHPSLTPQNTNNLENVLWGFIDGLQPINPDRYPSDEDFHHIIHLNLEESLVNQLHNQLIPKLNSLLPTKRQIPVPTSEDLNRILSQSLVNLTQVRYTREIFKYDALDRVAILLGGNLAEKLIRAIATPPSDSPHADKLPSAQVFLDQLRADPNSKLPTFPGSYHVTLTHCNHPDPELQSAYLTDLASGWLGEGVEVTFDKLVWQPEAIMALSVQSIHRLPSPQHPSHSLPIPLRRSITTCSAPTCSPPTPCPTCLPPSPALYTSTDFLHVTIGSLSSSPFQPNHTTDLLHAAFTPSSSPSPSSHPHALPPNFHWHPIVYPLPTPITLPGRIRAYPTTSTPP